MVANQGCPLLEGEARGVAQALAAWRERRAMATNIPLRRVMSDMALLGIAQAAPRSTEDLAHARGVDERYLSGSIAREILAAVKEGRDRVVELDAQAHDPLENASVPPSRSSPRGSVNWLGPQKSTQHWWQRIATSLHCWRVVNRDWPTVGGGIWWVAISNGS